MLGRTAKTLNAKEVNYLQPHRKDNAKARKAYGGKPQKQPKQTPAPVEGSITEPMYQLSRDINRWFNEVMTHLAKAEREAAASAVQESSARSKKQQRLNNNKTIATADSRKSAHTGNSGKTAGDVRAENEGHLMFRQTNQKKCTGGKAEKQFDTGVKSEQGAFEKLSNVTSSVGVGSKTAPSNAQKKLNHQLSALNGELSRSDVQNDHEGGQVYGHGASGIQSGHLSSDGTKMLEIRPSLVENSERNDARLASTASWLPYGARQDSLPESAAGQNQRSQGNEGHSKVKIVSTNSAAAAVASNVLSGSSRHQLVSKTGAPDRVVSPTSKISKQNSWEKGKGFILLNNKEKEKEALERKAWLKKNQSENLLSGKNCTGFILVDSEKPSDVSRSASKKNVLLNDNPHVMAAERASDKSGTRNMEETSTASSTGKFCTGDQCNRRSHIVKETQSALSTASKEKAKEHNPIREYVSSDLKTSRWVDLVQRKLFEIQSAKIAAGEQTEGIKSQLRQGVSTDQVVKNIMKDTSHNVEQGRLKKEASGGVNAGAPKDIDGDRGNVPEIKIPPPSAGRQDPDLDTNKRSVSDPKTSDVSDEEYERRIGQFIDSSMGYEDSVDSSRISKIFGPLTREQHNLLEKARDAGNLAYLGNTEFHRYLQSRDQPRPVPVHELKPDFKPAPKSEKAEKYPSKKAEPTLYVKPEEIATVKKPVPVSPSEALKTFGKMGSPDQKFKPLNLSPARTRELSTANEEPNLGFEQSELWLSMQDFRTNLDNNRTLSKSNSKEDKGRQGKAILSRQDIPSEVTDGNDKFLNLSESSHTKTKSTDRVSDAKGADNHTPVSFQHEFIKMQQEKLVQSRLEKSLQQIIDQPKTKDIMAPKSPSANSNPLTSKGDAGGKRGKQQTPITPKAPIAATRSLDKASIDYTVSSKAESKSRRGMPLADASSKDLDPFEAWIQSMKDWKPDAVDKSSTALGADSINKDFLVNNRGNSDNNLQEEGPVLRDYIQAKQPPEPKSKKRKKYSRFEQEHRADVAKEMYRDIHVTYTTPGQSVTSSLSEAPNKPAAIPMTTVSQSDQIYNMIKESVQPYSGIPLAGITAPIPKGRRSKLLTQAGMGTIINNSTGLVDPARLPKLGNLFSSIDGFITMDAVRVLDADTMAKSTQSDRITPNAGDVSVKNASRSLSSGDGVAGKERFFFSCFFNKLNIEEDCYR